MAKIDEGRLSDICKRLEPIAFELLDCFKVGDNNPFVNADDTYVRLFQYEIVWAVVTRELWYTNDMGYIDAATKKIFDKYLELIGVTTDA